MPICQGQWLTKLICNCRNHSLRLLPLGAKSSKEKKANVTFPGQQSSWPPRRLFSPERSKQFFMQLLQYLLPTLFRNKPGLYRQWTDSTGAVILHFRTVVRSLTTLPMVTGLTENQHRRQYLSWGASEPREKKRKAQFSREVCLPWLNPAVKEQKSRQIRQRAIESFNLTNTFKIVEYNHNPNTDKSIVEPSLIPVIFVCFLLLSELSMIIHKQHWDGQGRGKVKGSSVFSGFL